ncbi:GGDEF domain-containing protein [Saccharophagus sp. K07]|jgi:diguanylate cyclase (GGDEF)-like protein|uniref:GGDEF domain-containing protein n=1 Tax=Saccharophagus sp. K07 TaxID=2283636 RepID=UPI001651B900|nr:GGDEF domain-containing protein [Saccharophagus sp. K07]MBC6905171.1 GGDEF domain-containing protein [Saccharophagus sp. K07]
MKQKPPSRHLNAAKIALALASCLALFSFPYIPQKKLDIYPGSQVWWGAFTDAASGGNSSFEYMNEAHTALECSIGDAGTFNLCGNAGVFVDHDVINHSLLLSDLALATRISPDITRDVSSYTGVWVDIDYRGPAKYIYLSLHNHEPALDLPDPGRQFRPQSVGIATSELHQPVFARLQEFKVADWWINQFALHRTESHTRFDRLQAITVEIKEQHPHTQHYLEVKSVKFVGDRVSKENFYLTIIIAFASLLGLEGTFRVYTLYKSQRAAQKSLDELNEYNRQLRSEAYKDELTQLLNRRAVQEIVSQKREFGNPQGLAIIAIDIDHFKKFNDTYGHAVGDKVLINVAQALKQVSREYDQIARWGGEEFVIITRDASPENLLIYAEKLREKVASSPIFNDGDPEPILVTISIGITRSHIDEDFEAAFERADKALYQSKEKGRNCCTFFKD